MKRTAQVFALLVVLYCLLPSSSAFGQAVYGSIYGTVTDATGAAIPNATITVTDEAKGTSVNVTSNETGDFRADHLIPDVYDLSVAMSGFESYTQKGIQILADTSVKVAPTMKPGATTTTVEVNADAVPQLKTDRADVATEFDTRDVANLPIQGRNFTSLQLLLPGAQQLGWNHAADENPQGSQQIVVDGQVFGGVGYILDGTDNQDPILGIIVLNPVLDSISESKITTQNFDAEFGKAVASIVTAQTKSGTNSFHGTAYDFRESNANLATNPFANSNGHGDPAHILPLLPGGLRNQFGGDIGGPILKNKFFFFGDYEGVRQKVGTSASMTVPSQFLINTCLGATTTTGVPGCDFSEYSTALGAAGTIYQPNGTPYPGNVIPASQLSQPALNLFKLLQPYAPNKGTAGTLTGLQNNYASSGTGLFNSDTWAERVDFQISQGMHAFERFSRFTDTLSGNTIFGPAGGAGFGISNYGGNSTGANDSLATGMDIAISPSLLTDWRFGYYRYNVIDVKYDQGTDFATQLGIPGINLGDTFTSGAPGFNITDVGKSGGPTNPQSGGAQYGSGLNITRCNCPLTQKEDQFQLVNNWTKLWRNHTFKVGVDLRYARNLRVPSDSDRAGLLAFGTGPTSLNGTTGGLGFASFVLGQSTAFNRYVSVSTNAKEFQKRDFFYGQDTWRVTPNLTLNLGLRYELYFPESVNAKGNGSLMQMNNYASTDGFLRVAGYGNVASNMGWGAATNAWNPRVGIAYQVRPTTVIRGGYGRSFDLGVFGSIFGHVVTQNIPVLANQALSTGAPTGYVFCLVPDTGCAQPAGQPAVGGPVPYVFPAVPSDGLLPAPGATVSVKTRPNTLRLPTLDAWNLAVQQSLTPTVSLTIAYVGNKGTHTLSGGLQNNTNPNEAAIHLPAQYSVEGIPLHYDPNPINPDANGIGTDGGTKNTNLLSRFYGAVLPGCQDPNYVQPTGPGLVPGSGQCGWTQGINYYGDDQDSHYNALQVTVAKQMSHNLSFNSAFAWQRGVDWANNYATWSRPAVKGRTNDLREVQEILYGVWNMPFGHGQKYMASSSGWVNQIVGGWTFSPVMTWSSGLPWTINIQNCGPYTPSSAPCYPNGSGNSLVTHVGPYNPTAHTRQYFNAPKAPNLPNGFTYPTLDQIGTAGRNDAWGPHYFNTDMSLMKNFTLHEAWLLQFRFDAYNGFNNINLNFNGSGGSAPIDNGPQFISSMAPGQNAIGSPRQLQFSFRLQF